MPTDYLQQHQFGFGRGQIFQMALSAEKIRDEEILHLYPLLLRVNSACMNAINTADLMF